MRHSRITKILLLCLLICGIMPMVCYGAYIFGNYLYDTYNLQIELQSEDAFKKTITLNANIGKLNDGQATLEIKEWSGETIDLSQYTATREDVEGLLLTYSFVGWADVPMGGNDDTWVTGEVDWQYLVGNSDIVLYAQYKPVETITIDYITYRFNSQYSNYEVIGNTLNANVSVLSVTVLSSLDGYGVYEILENAFSDCEYTGGIVISEGITSIKDKAFYDSKFSGTLNLPSTLGHIGMEAFMSCPNLKGNLEIPENVTSLEHGVFMDSGFDGNLTLHNKLISVGSYAFARCDFTGEIVIPASVETIAEGAFFSAFASSGATLSFAAGSTLTTIGDYAFQNGTLQGNLTIPASVTSIGAYAFSETTFNGTLTFESGSQLRKINLGAFQESTFTGSLTIPSTVCLIDGNAFADCYGFDGTLTINPSKRLEIGICAFGSSVYDVDPDDGSLTSDPSKAMRFTQLLLSGNIKKIGNKAFAGMIYADSNIIIPNSVTNIDHKAFLCYADSVATGDRALEFEDGTSDLSLGDSAFNRANFTNQLKIIARIKSIGWNAFEQSKITDTLTIPSTLGTLAGYAFSGCSGLTKLVIDGFSGTIQQGAFRYCAFTGDLTIPSSVKKIEFNAFEGAFTDIGTSTLTINIGLAKIDDNAFLSCKQEFEKIYILNLDLAYDIAKLKAIFANSDYASLNNFSEYFFPITIPLTTP